MQLAAEITNLELLLDGALNDKLDPITGKARRVYTIGFPITFSLPDPATAKQRENSAAEIHVALCPVSGYASVMTLLPQERTYNVAGLVDHSFSGSATGVLAGVMSVGGGFLWSHKRYDMVQQQETIALMQGRGDMRERLRPLPLRSLGKSFRCWEASMCGQGRSRILSSSRCRGIFLHSRGRSC